MLNSTITKLLNITKRVITDLVINIACLYIWVSEPNIDYDKKLRILLNYFKKKSHNKIKIRDKSLGQIIT